jgi:hypothetical protein
MRFNYQQRVGRAGRRGSGVAAALTVCRGRSHDDFYFQNIERITSEPPPQPYLDLKREEILLRVMTAETLRRAFSAHFAGGLREAGDNVHGQFGLASDWSNRKAHVCDWLQSNRELVDTIVTTLLLGAPETVLKRREVLVDYLVSHLPGRIDDAVNDERLVQSDLSERLANYGLLPMFGFPTRVRLLYHRAPSPRNWPPERGVVDRDLDIAISQFAPGAETVKDKAIHTAIGVANYELKGETLAPDPNPLGPVLPVGICHNCQALDTTPGEKTDCPTCGSSDEYQRLQLSEPHGFRTDYTSGRSFDGQFEWTARASRARMAADLPDTVWTAVGPARLYAGQQSVYAINDNHGASFEFKRMANGDGWIVPEVLASSTIAVDQTVAPETRALASITKTDVLLLGLDGDQYGGLNLSPIALGARAAWYSFGFFLRNAAAKLLDVDSNELRVGLRTLIHRGRIEGEVFLADSLENGAGYSTYLGRPAVFSDLLQFMLQGYGLDHHTASGQPCDSACYDCLKDYSNMAYHSLLDWRLALDLAGLAAGVSINLTSHWNGLAESLIGSFCNAFTGWSPAQFGPLAGAIQDDGEVALIAVHPLWERRFDGRGEEFSTAVVDAERRGFSESGPRRWMAFDLFDLSRRPTWVAASIWERE